VLADGVVVGRIFKANANVDRNSFLPLHPGAIGYYRQIGKAGQTD
jgi:TRAP-type uncharacterized transport system substrate-binding protein